MGLILAAVVASCQIVSSEGAALPDARCTPGGILPVTAKDVCVKGYSSKVRNVPYSQKLLVMQRYGVHPNHHGEQEIDHLISLELGGSNAIENLWPEPAYPKPGFHEKDQLENALHALVCSGKLELGKAQHDIALDWWKAYKKYVRTPRMPQEPR